MPNKIAVLILTIAMSACAGATPKPPQAPEPIQARCNDKPQWATKDIEGRDVGIYVCFGAENRLLYSVRLISSDLPAPKQKAARRTK